MNKEDLKNIIFDFDGVIYPSQNYHLDKLNRLFCLDLTMDEYANTALGNFHEKAEKCKKLSRVKWEKYNSEIIKDFPALKTEERFKKFLEKLSEKYNLFIISSAYDKHIEKFLENNGIKKLFKKRLYMNDHKLKTEKFKMLEKEFKISPQNSIFITDTVGDVLEAKAVGYKSLCVLSGLHNREQLEKSNPLMIKKDILDYKKDLL